ncbi:MAG: bifunctional methylenetetrahydrofolate dehydrogenase/methenyltetrahydrofolate cyclohydrolase FolD [Gemmatimonadaceae bacterium]
MPGEGGTRTAAPSGRGVLIDGKAVAARLNERVAERVRALEARGIVPGLSVVLVGEDPASAAYVKSKGKACDDLGLRGETIRMPASISEDELIAVVDRLNATRQVHGILVQMPLPKQIRPDVIIRRIDPAKDVDGFHPVNVGKMLIGEPDAFVPCTPAGVMVLLREYRVRTAGARCVVVGRSNIVGKPMMALMVQPGADATVTVCHSRTLNIAEHTRQADIVIAAAGKPALVTGDMIKPGAVVVDVGINRVEDPAAPRGYRLVGDVDFESAREVASLITPVPGGVGPMTIAMLMENTLRAAERSVA